MQRAHGRLWLLGIGTFLGMGLVSLLLPWPAQSGGVQVSVGVALPAPVAVTPAPIVVASAPVVVSHPPVVVAQSYPVVVQPAPVVAQRPPVVVQQSAMLVVEPYPGQAYCPYYGYGWWRRARYWHQHD